MLRIVLATSVLVLVVAFLGIRIFLIGSTPLTTTNFKQALSYFLAPQTNELATKEYVDFTTAQNGQPIATDLAIFDNKSVANNLSKIPSFFELTQTASSQVLGETTGQDEEKWIEVNLSEQKLYAWQGQQKVYEFSISSGRQWTPTVQGEFRIWAKMKAVRMRGGSPERGDFYDLPNVPYTMFFHDGYGIHGAYWHDNFGTPMSHGCVNLRVEDAKALFEWTSPVIVEGQWSVQPTPASPGTRIVIHV